MASVGQRHVRLPVAVSDTAAVFTQGDERFISVDKVSCASFVVWREENYVTRCSLCFWRHRGDYMMGVIISVSSQADKFVHNTVVMRLSEILPYVANWRNR